MIKFDVNDFLTFDLIPDWTIFVMYPEKRYLSLKVRKFIDHLRGRLSDMKNY
jgi:DNA-binding transcriptional LysR family regulator